MVSNCWLYVVHQVTMEALGETDAGHVWQWHYYFHYSQNDLFIKLTALAFMAKFCTQQANQYLIHYFMKFQGVFINEPSHTCKRFTLVLNKVFF